MMRINRRNLLLAGASLPMTSCAAGGRPRPAAETNTFIFDINRKPDEEIELWPDGPPGGDNVTVVEQYVERDNPFGLPDRAAHNVTRPTLSLFRAANPNGTAILIIPGGGYKWVVVEKEGYEGARYFNRSGAHVYVLKYRLPHQGWAAGPDTPLQDAQRAMRIIRQRATTDGVDPTRVMAMGFSAGGHLAGSLTQRFDASVYDAVDIADSQSARPDLSVLVYPVALMGSPFTHAGSQECLLGTAPSAEALSKYDLSNAPNPEGPPVFLLHTLDDGAVPVENSLQLVAAYRRANVPAVIHVFDEGGHGFGMRGIEDTPLAAWPSLVIDWARARSWT